MFRSNLSVSELCVDSFLKDASTGHDPKEEEFSFFPDVLSHDRKFSDLSSMGQSNSISPTGLTDPSVSNDMDNVWGWEADNFDEEEFLDFIDDSLEDQSSLVPGPPISGTNMLTSRPRAPKKRMLEISATAALRAEAAAKNKALTVQLKRDVTKRVRIRRKAPVKRKEVVEQKLVELVKTIKICRRVMAEPDYFLSSGSAVGSSPAGHAPLQRIRVVSLAIETFLNSFMFVKPSEHEYIFQLVRPISESCSLSIPGLVSLTEQAKAISSCVHIASSELLGNALPVFVPAKFYGFSEILKASEMFGDVIRFLLSSSTHLHALSTEDLIKFTTTLEHSSSTISASGNKFTAPFSWKSEGLTTNMELRGLVSCTLNENLVASITLHFDPFSIVKQSVPLACDMLVKPSTYFTGSF